MDNKDTLEKPVVYGFASVFMGNWFFNESKTFVQYPWIPKNLI